MMQCTETNGCLRASMLGAGLIADSARRLLAALMLAFLLSTAAMCTLTGCTSAGSSAGEGAPVQDPVADGGEVDSESSEPSDAVVDPDTEIEVWVLDQMREQPSPGSSYNATVTTFEYDSAGRAVRSQQRFDDIPGDSNLCQSTYGYDSEGRLATVSLAFGQYDWNVGQEISFSYDEQGRCVSYTTEIVSQGTGKRVTEYSYGADGRISSAVLKDYAYPAAEPVSYGFTWVYADDGMLERVVCDKAGGPGIVLDETLSYPAEGLFVYRDMYDSTIELRFDEEGRLESRAVRDGGNMRNCCEYTYKSITVKASDFIPSVVSNPVGLDYLWCPQPSSGRAIANR